MKIRINLFSLVCGLTFGLVHLRTKWGEEGITCIDCGYFKSKFEHTADLHAGGGW